MRSAFALCDEQLAFVEEQGSRYFEVHAINGGRCSCR
jgi:hypothetical protein